MDSFAHPLLAYFGIALAGLCVYGVHRYWLVATFLRRRGEPDPAAPQPGERPVVTVQLPIFNEPKVAERVIDAVAALEYPRDRLQIQVLDDSTDETTEIVRRRCRSLAESGVDIAVLHRAERSGFKAGALAEGLASARGELVAMFDADFVPEPDFLARTVGFFADTGIGLVQTRWSHLNRDASWLTRLQAMSLDAHFVIEQRARYRSGRWFNFNGTAGVWRRRCIDDAGGWQRDTLTEDTDLSYRAQLRGWRFVYLNDVACAAEIPPTVSAFMGQQHRWNKGLIQTAIKLLPAIMRSSAPWRTKLEAWFHLTAPLPYVFVLMIALLAVPALVMTLRLEGARTALAFGLSGGCLLLGTSSAVVFYLVAELDRGARVGSALLRIVAVMAVGIGVSLLNTRTVLGAVYGRAGAFVRTPKFAGARRSARDPLAPQRLPEGLVELALGLAMLAASAAAVVRPVTLVGIPFLALFAAGFLSVGIGGLRERVSRRAVDG